MEFKVGDRVVGIGTYDELDIDGQIGTVKHINSFSADVEFDEAFNQALWACCGTCKSDHGWVVKFDHLRLLKESGRINHGELLKALAKEDATGYHKDSEGFLTNPDNWEPGKWLI